MRNLLTRWVLSAGALFVTVLILDTLELASPGNGPWYGWFVAVAAMGLVNTFIRPILRLLTAPLNCLTFGLAGWGVNALMFWLVPVLARAVGMEVFTLKPLGALLGSALVGLLTTLAGMLLPSDKRDE